MKTRKQTDRRYHIRRVASGVVPVRKHLMHYWAKINTFRGRFNSAGGKQYVNTFEPRNKKAVLEIQHLVEPSGLKYSAVALRKHDWEQGRWERKEFRSKAEAEAYAKTIMSKDSDGDGVPDVVDCDPHDSTKQDEPKKTKGDWFAEFDKKTLTEAEVNLMIRRINSGQLSRKLEDGHIVPEVDFPEDGYNLTSEQVEKGRKWLMSLWKTPSGKEREDNPFGWREQDVMDNFETIRFIDVYSDRGYNYVPYYRVEGKDGIFEYANVGGKIQILG